MLQILPIRMPGYFYLPRYSRCGFDVRDVMPWENALSYMSDGARFGVQFRDGRIEWLLLPTRSGVLANEYLLVEESLPPALRIDTSACEIVREIWRKNAGTLAEMAAASPSTTAVSEKPLTLVQSAAGWAQAGA